jgi:hypothetical protein
VNRVVDIAPTFETKLAGIRACRTMIDHMVKDLETSLAERKLRLPALSNNEFIKQAFQQRDANIGKRHGLEYAEEFHYIGPDSSLQRYIEQNAVPLG